MPQGLIGIKAKNSDQAWHSFYVAADSDRVIMYTEGRPENDDSFFLFGHDEWEQIVAEIKRSKSSEAMVEALLGKGHARVKFHASMTPDDDVILAMGDQQLADSQKSLRVFIAAVMNGEFDLDVVLAGTTTEAA